MSKNKLVQKKSLPSSNFCKKMLHAEYWKEDLVSGPKPSLSLSLSLSMKSIMYEKLGYK